MWLKLPKIWRASAYVSVVSDLNRVSLGRQIRVLLSGAEALITLAWTLSCREGGFLAGLFLFQQGLRCPLWQGIVQVSTCRLIHIWWTEKPKEELRNVPERRRMTAGYCRWCPSFREGQGEVQAHYEENLKDETYLVQSLRCPARRRRGRKGKLSQLLAICGAFPRSSWPQPGGEVVLKRRQPARAGQMPASPPSLNENALVP